MSIESDLDRYAKQAVNACAREIKKEIKEEAKQTVDKAFYNTYDPSSSSWVPPYQRIYGLKTAYQERDTGRGGFSREVGVEFSPGYVSGSHKVSNDSVYEWSLEEGAHGWPGYAGTVVTGRPFDYMESQFQHTVARVPGIIQRNFHAYFG